MHDFFLHFFGPDPLAYVDETQVTEPDEESKEPIDTIDAEESKVVETTADTVTEESKTEAQTQDEE